LITGGNGGDCTEKGVPFFSMKVGSQKRRGMDRQIRLCGGALKVEKEDAGETNWVFAGTKRGGGGSKGQNDIQKNTGNNADEKRLVNQNTSSHGWLVCSVGKNRTKRKEGNTSNSRGADGWVWVGRTCTEETKKIIERGSNRNNAE